MQRYRIAAPFRFILLAALLGPVGGAALVLLLLVLAYAFNMQPPTPGLDVLSDGAGFWRLLYGAPLVTLVVGLVPALLSSVLILAIAKWWPIAFAEVVALTGSVAVAMLYFAGPSYFHDTAWIILVPVVPAAIATWLVARRLGYVVAAP